MTVIYQNTEGILPVGAVPAAIRQAALHGYELPSSDKSIFEHCFVSAGIRACVLAHQCGEPQTSALCEKWKLALLNTPGAVWNIAGALHASGKRDVVLGDRRPVHEALTYLENHGERMHYAEARARGLPISSGNVEATCKSLVALRMKPSGCSLEGSVRPAHP